MKNIIYLLLVFTFYACSEKEKIHAKDEEFIKSFVVTVGDEKIEGIIDNEKHTISLPGIDNGLVISKIEYILSDGTLVYPDPNTFIGSWDITEKFQVRSTDGNEYRYTVSLPDYIKKSNYISVDFDKKEQQILFVGADMERSQSFMQKCAKPELVAEWCFKDIPFEICRVAYDKQQELLEGNKTPEFYNDAIKSMQMLKKVNPEIKFWATMKSDYSGYDNENNLPEWICNYTPTTYFYTDKYAAFLADYLELMYKNGVAIDYLATAKEWYSVLTPKRSVEVLTKLNSECERRGIPKPKYVDPATWGISQGVQFIQNTNVQNNKELYYGFSTHNLNPAESAKMLYEKFVNASASLSKPAFADETAYGNGGRTEGVEPQDLSDVLTAYLEKVEFYRDGIQGELFFEVFSRGVNAETRSVYFKNGGMPKKMRSYYILKEFATGLSGKNKYYVDPQFTDVDTGVHSMAFVTDNSVFIVLLNTSQSNIENIGVTCENFNKKISDVEFTRFTVHDPIEGYKEKTEELLLDNMYITDLSPLSISFVKFDLE